MRNLDAFSAQLVDFVRRMPDDALLALVRSQLGAAVLGGSALADMRSLPQVRAKVSAATAALAARDSSPAGSATGGSSNGATGRGAAGKRGAKRGGRQAAAPAGRKAAGGARKSTGTRRGRGSAAGRQELLGAVERIVKASSGVSASEVAKSASVPQSRASSALKELKLAKRIFQGGDRRFARYAGDAKTAQGASDAARKTASGPISKRRR